MQPLTDGPRAGFTTAQVQYLIENTSSFDTDFGLQVLDDLSTLNVVDDLQDALTACTVSRNSFATIHGAATFTLDTALDWGRTIVRPYMTITGPTSAAAVSNTTMQFYLGCYYADSPEEDLSESATSVDCTGYDVLSVLDDPIGDDFSIDVGILYLAQVEEILIARGVTSYHIDQDAAAAACVSPKVYTLDSGTTWLTVINDCLAAIGYQGIWTDWNGSFQVRDYTTPSLRAPEYWLTADISNTLLTQRKKRQRDYYPVPNRWVFYQQNQTEVQPVDGAGRYEFINTSTGPTSVEAVGRVKSAAPEGVDVADQASLVAYAQRVIDADMLVPTKFVIETAPFPLAWHMDRYVVTDPAFGAQVDVLGATWSLNLDGSDMQHEWSEV